MAEGNRFAQERQYDKAVDAFKQALRINPEQAGAQLGLGSAYHNMGRLADALGPLTAAVGLEPQNAVAHLNLGITLAALRRPEDAMIELNEAKRLNPQSARIHNEVGNVLHNSFAQMDGALAAYQEAARLDTSVPAVHHNIGLMLMRLGRSGQALEPFIEALRLEPDYRNARYHLRKSFFCSATTSMPNRPSPFVSAIRPTIAQSARAESPRRVLVLRQQSPVSPAQARGSRWFERR